MWNDPIVEETRRLRDEFAKKHNYSIRAMVAELKQWEEEGFPLPSRISQDNPSAECVQLLNSTMQCLKKKNC